MGSSAKKIIKKVVPKEIIKPFVPPPPTPPAAPPPPPVAAAPKPTPAPEPAPAAAPAAMAAPEPSPAVSDPAPAGEPTESEMTAQKIQKKKKGMKKKYSHRSCRSRRRSTDLHNNSILGFTYARQNSSNAC